MINVVLIILSIHFNRVLCGNILLASDLASPSHHGWHKSVIQTLVDAGHNVTLLDPYGDETENTNTHYIRLEGHPPVADSNLLDNFAGHSTLQGMRLYYQFTIEFCQSTLRSQGLDRLLAYPKDFKFDLLIMDLTSTSCLLALIQRFGYPPTMGITAYPLPTHVFDIFGNEPNPGYLPMFMFSKLEMTFFDRVENYIATYMDMLLRNTYIDSTLTSLMREKFGQGVDSLKNFQRHISMVFVNMNFAFHTTQPLTPNIIPIGGAHIKPAGRLPKDIQEIMDNAKHGVILMALGTNVRSDQLKPFMKKALLDTFRQLNQTVLWKFESPFVDAPQNVIIRKWLPQAEILAHPNIKLFVSHGGGLSTTESAYFGVPVLGMPFFMDQYVNVRSMIKRKLGQIVDYRTLTSKILLEKIQEILHDPSYALNMKEISRRFRDQLNTPQERIVFWSEFVIRHNGSNFLDTEARNLPLFISSSNDVKLFLLATIVLIIYLLKFLIQRIKLFLGRPKIGKPKLN